MIGGNRLKKLGIIGGMGPMATAYFYRRIVELTDARCDQEHIPTLIYSEPSIPDRTAFLLGSSNVSPLPYLISVGQALQAQGAEVLAIPCITAHAFHREMEEGIGVPILHAIRLVGETLARDGVRKIGVMATDGAIQTGIYEDTLRDFGIENIRLPDATQAMVMKMIYDEVKAGKNLSMDTLDTVANVLRDKGAERLILGCTELSLAKRDAPLASDFIDVIDVLAQGAVQYCKGD